MIQISHNLLSDFPKSLLDKSKILNLKKGEYLFRCGDQIRYIYYVLEGEIRGLRNQVNGSTAIMIRTCSGQFFAPVSLIMEIFPCSGFAAIRSKVVQFPVDAFKKSMKDFPDFSYYFSVSLSTSLKKQCALAERFRLKSARDRILHYLACETPSGN